MKPAFLLLIALQSVLAVRAIAGNDTAKKKPQPAQPQTIPAAPLTDYFEVTATKPEVVTAIPNDGRVYVIKTKGTIVTCPQYYGLYVRPEKKGDPNIFVYVMPGQVQSNLVHSTSETPYTVACLMVK